MARSRTDGVYRCDIRSLQQESGGGRRGLRREPGAKGANGATSIGDAWGVRTRARVCGQERQNQRYERRGMDAGGPGGREPPRRLSGGQCGGADGRRAKHAAGDDGSGVRSGVDTSAGGDAEAGAGRSAHPATRTRSGRADDEGREANGASAAMSQKAASRVTWRSSAW